MKMTTTDEDFAPAKPASYRDLEMVEDGKGQEIAVAHAGLPAYTQYSAEMIALVGKSIMPPKYRPEELYYVLELAATYKLDPLTKEIWAVRMSDDLNKPVTVMVGVEGLKKIASRDPAYRGFRVSEVYAHDDFEFSNDIRKLGDGSFTHVKHSYSLADDRGGLLGAYCEVYRDGWPPAFFWAPLEEYFRTGSMTPWNRQKTAMIRKCAIVNGLRQCYQVSALYIEEEMTPRFRNGAAVEDVEASEEAFYGDDEEVELRLRSLFDTLGSKYLPTKRKLLLNDLDDAGRLELVATLEAEVQEAGLELPPEPVAEEGEIVDEPPAVELTPEQQAEVDKIEFGEKEDGQATIM
jgi:phage recombination protein Bet